MNLNNCNHENWRVAFKIVLGIGIITIFSRIHNQIFSRQLFSNSCDFSFLVSDESWVWKRNGFLGWGFKWDRLKFASKSNLDMRRIAWLLVGKLTLWFVICIFFSIDQRRQTQNNSNASPCPFHPTNLHNYRIGKRYVLKDNQIIGETFVMTNCPGFG